MRRAAGFHDDQGDLTIGEPALELGDGVFQADEDQSAHVAQTNGGVHSISQHGLPAAFRGFAAHYPQVAGYLRRWPPPDFPFLKPSGRAKALSGHEHVIAIHV